MKKRIVGISMSFIFIFNIIFNSVSMITYAHTNKQNTDEKSYPNNDYYRNRYIEYNSIDTGYKIEKAMLYNDKAYARIKQKGLPYQYVSITEDEETLIPEINSKAMTIFDDKNGILAEVDEFYAAYKKTYSDEKFYKYDIDTKEIKEIIPDIEGYNEFLEVLEKEGYSLRSAPSGYNEVNPIWVGFECYSPTEYNSVGFYNRKTKKLVTYKDYGFDRIELIKAYGDRAYFTYKNNHSDIDESNDESYIVMVENGQFTKIGDIYSKDVIVDISQDGKCIIDEDQNLRAIGKVGESYRIIGYRGSISGDDAWYQPSSYDTINYYDKSTGKEETMYECEGSNNIVSKGKYNVFGFYMDFTGNRGEYFRLKHVETDRASINSVKISPDKIYRGYPYKISVDATEGALIKYIVVKDGKGHTYGYSNEKELIAQAENRNRVIVYVKNKDSKYNYDDKYEIEQFIGYHTYYPIYNLDKEAGKITGYSGKPVKIVVEGYDETLIQTHIAIPDKLGKYEVNLAYPLKGGEKIRISYASTTMVTSEYISLPKDWKINTTIVTTADDSINGQLKEWNGNGTVIARANGKELGIAYPGLYNRYSIPLSEKLEKGTKIDIVAYNSKNQEIARETLEVYEDNFPEINILKENISILETDVENYNFKSLVKAMDRENGDITESIVIKENTVTNEPGDYKVVYSVSDYKGQKVEKEIKVNVRSNTQPTISGVSDITIKVGDEFDPLKGVKAYDKEDGDLTSNIGIDGKVDNKNPGKYILTYTVGDSDGNYDMQHRVVNVRSNEKPVISASDVTLKVGDKFEPLSGVSASDKEDGEIIKIEVKGDEVDTSKVGEYKVVYEVTDKDGNTVSKEIKVTVRSNEKPVITASDVTLKVGDEFEPLSGVSASDKEDGEITKIEVKGDKVDTSKVGEYKVVYEVTDKDGNTVSKEIKVTVRSNEKPVISASDVTLKVGDKFDPLSIVSASDKEDGEITKIEVKGDKVDTSKVGVYKVVYEVTDKDGNTVSKEIKVVVRSNEKPVITASDVTLKVGDKFDPLSGVSASDKEDGKITKIEVKGDKVDTSKVGEYKVIYEVTDKDGNTVSKEIKVAVQQMKNGWIYENAKWYYYNQNGEMQKGWLNLDGIWYYLRSNGEMSTGWELVNGTWYYLDGSGAMVTGWLNDNGTWYYLDGSGAMVTGWLNDNGTWYYLDGSGAMVTGWLNLGGIWYYLDGSGVMQTGWQLINGTWYYMYSSGQMATNTNIDGWKIDSNGVATKIE